MIRGEHRTASLAALLVAAGAVPVVWLWWSHAPRNTSVVDAATSTGQLAGLLLGYLVAVQLIAMSRLPLIERWLGGDELSRLHARAGRVIAALLVIHVGAVVLGYARSAGSSVGAEIATLWRHYPDIPWAVAGAVLLILVGVTSARAARRALGYDRWRAVHLLAYLAAAAAFSHQFADGQDFIHSINRFPRLAWSALYLVAVGCVVFGRVIRPLALGWRDQWRVVDVVEHPGQVATLSIAGRRSLHVQAGQYVRIRPVSRRWPWSAIPLSVSTTGDGVGVSVSVRSVGQDSRAVASLAPGAGVRVDGPYGVVTADRATSARVVLIAAGIGITAMLPLFDELSRRGPAVLINRVPSPDHVLFASELEAIAAATGGRMVLVAGSREDVGGRFEAAVSDAIGDVRDVDVFVCAPAELTDRIRQHLAGLNVPSARIHTESYSFDDEGAPRRALLPVAAVVLLVLAGVGLRIQLAAGSGQWAPTAQVVAPAPSAGAVSAGGRRIVPGPIIGTLYSRVQVAAVLFNGKLVGVQPLEMPNLDERSRQITARAVPLLTREAIASGGLNIHAITGATYTSGAYAESLHGALDAARSARS